MLIARKIEHHIIVIGDMICEVGDLINGNNKEDISKGRTSLIKMTKKNIMKEDGILVALLLVKCKLGGGSKELSK